MLPAPGPCLAWACRCPEDGASGSKPASPAPLLREYKPTYIHHPKWLIVSAFRPALLACVCMCVYPARLLLACVYAYVCVYVGGIPY